ncbi:polyhydroxyalkanoate depolymerase [Oligella ureolytica]
MFTSRIWVDARNVPVNQGAFDLDEYVYYIISFLHALNKRVHIMAVCQPSVPVFAAVSLMSEQNDPIGSGQV